MDTKELIKKCKAISLDGDKRGKVTIRSKMKENGEKILAGCLVGKVLLNREEKKESFKAALLPVWKTMKDVKIEELGENIFIFQFGSEADKRKVFTGGPWHFDKALIVLTELAGIGEITKQAFTHVSFWVQILNVPIMCMNKETIRELGEAIGRVEEVATDITGACFGKYIRLRISVDITKPLIKALYMKQEEDEDKMDRGEEEEGDDTTKEGGEEKEITMPVRYERLPDFCYVCEHVGHQYRECTNYKNQWREEMAYGPWMKAPTITEQIKQNRRKENGRTDQGQTSKDYTTMGVQGEQGNPETIDGVIQKPGQMGTGQEPSQWRAFPRMSSRNSRMQSETAGENQAVGESQLEAGKEKQFEREAEGEKLKKHQQEEDNRLSTFSPNKGAPIETNPLLYNQKAHAKE